MQRSICTKMDDIESSTETESLIASTLTSMSDHEVDNTRSVSVTSEEVAWRIRVVTDSLTQQLAHLCELMCELKNEQANRRYEATTSFRDTCFSSGSGSRSDTLPPPTRKRAPSLVSDSVKITHAWVKPYQPRATYYFAYPLWFWGVRSGGGG